MLHAVVTGTGPPVVLLHGVTLQWWVWSAVIRLLRSDHRVIAWDMRGHGESKAGTRGVTLEACADDLAQILIELDAYATRWWWGTRWVEWSSVVS